MGEKKREIREIRRKKFRSCEIRREKWGGEREKTKRKIALFKRKTRQPQLVNPYGDMGTLMVSEII